MKAKPHMSHAREMKELAERDLAARPLRRYRTPTIRTSPASTLARKLDRSRGLSQHRGLL